MTEPPWWLTIDLSVIVMSAILIGGRFLDWRGLTARGKTIGQPPCEVPPRMPPRSVRPGRMLTECDRAASGRSYAASLVSG
jgi:hypothetical protein